MISEFVKIIVAKSAAPVCRLIQIALAIDINHVFANICDMVNR